MNDRLTKVCPNCNTRFETDAKFCPHDSAVLVENPEALRGITRAVEQQVAGVAAD